MKWIEKKSKIITNAVGKFLADTDAVDWGSRRLIGIEFTKVSSVVWFKKFTIATAFLDAATYFNNL